MKKTFFRKSICALLILIFIFNTVSCTANNSESENNGKLEIVEENPEYTESYATSVTERFSTILDALLDERLGIDLSVKTREKLIAVFKDKIIPKLYSLKVYESELNEILASLEELLNEENGENYISLFTDLYECILYTLGSERAGIILFTVVTEILTLKIATAEERYEELGSPWYLDDIERCEALKNDLSKIGEKNFADKISAATFIVSTMKSAETGKESALMLSDAELLFILEHQGKLFLENASDEDGWRVIGRLITELIPALNFSDVAVTSILYALKQEAYFNSLIETMPRLFTLYASITQSLRNEAAFSLANTKEENDKAICSALLSSETELKSFYDSLHAYGSIDSDTIRQAVKNCSDKDALEEFLISHAPITYEALITELNKCAGGTQDALSIEEILIGVAYSVSPYLSFILFG